MHPKRIPKLWHLVLAGIVILAASAASFYFPPYSLPNVLLTLLAGSLSAIALAGALS